HGLDRDVGDAHGGRGARSRVEDGELTEHVGRAEDRQEVLATVGRLAGELHLAGGDDVEAVALLALADDRLALGALLAGEVGAHRGDGRRLDTLENPGAGEDVLGGLVRAAIDRHGWCPSVRAWTTRVHAKACVWPVPL